MTAVSAHSAPAATNGVTNPEFSAMPAVTTGPTAPPAAQAAFIAATPMACALGPGAAASATIAAVGVQRPDRTVPLTTAVISSGASDAYSGRSGSVIAEIASSTTVGRRRPTRSLSRPLKTL